MDLQIRFESWMRHYPHIKEMYDRNELTIKLDGDDNFTVETVMSDKHWTIWLLKHPKHACRSLGNDTTLKEKSPCISTQAF